MTAHREPGWVELLAAILRGTPRLSGALCVDRPELFDGEHNDTEDSDYPRTQALRICGACPELSRCREWVDSLPRADRPTTRCRGRLPAQRCGPGPGGASMTSHSTVQQTQPHLSPQVAAGGGGLSNQDHRPSYHRRAEREPLPFFFRTSFGEVLAARRVRVTALLVTKDGYR
jgi:hypothetical protein